MELSGQHHAPAALPPGENSRSMHRVGSLVGPKTGVRALERKSICRESKYDFLVVQPVVA